MTRTRPQQPERQAHGALGDWWRAVPVRVPLAPGRLHPRVVPALVEAGAQQLDLVVLRGERDYSRRFMGWWVQGGDLVVVEHDVEVAPTTLLQFAGCREPWCCFPYDGGAEALLGCTRFRPAELPAIPIAALAGLPWWELDMGLYELLRREGRRPHRHRPAPVHHHGWDAEGPTR